MKVYHTHMSRYLVCQYKEDVLNDVFVVSNITINPSLMDLKYMWYYRNREYKNHTLILSKGLDILLLHPNLKWVYSKIL